MPRLSYFGSRPCIVTCIAALFSAPLSAQTPAANSPHVQHVIVRGSDVRGSDMSGSGATIEVEIQTSGAPLEPDTQAITGPDRIVVDFPGAIPAAELRALQVNRGALKGIRSGLFFSNPPITRIVLDLSEPQSYQISTTQVGNGRGGWDCPRRKTSECLARCGYACRGLECCGPQSLDRSFQSDCSAASRRQ